MAERVILVPENHRKRLKEYESIEQARIALDAEQSGMLLLFHDEREPRVSNEHAIYLVLAHRLMCRLLQYETPNANPTQ